LSDEPGAEVGYQTRALTRALTILDAFGGDHEALSVATLHQSLKLPKPTIIRLAGVLEKYGYLRRLDGGYELGPKTLELGALYLRRHGVLDIVRPILERLRDEVGETICLASLSGPDVLHLDVIPSLRPIHYRTDVGSRAPAHSTALGKAILATLNEDQMNEVLGPPPYRALTPKTHTDRSSLLNEVELTRRRGYALDNEESALGLKCLGIAVVAPMLGTVAISASSSPASINSKTSRALSRALGQAGEEIVHALARATGHSIASQQKVHAP
jgi:IclR family acetate operon transcriptional repressor